MGKQSTSDKRGGRRAGAGRPKGTSKLYAFRAGKGMAAFIDEQESKTGFIRDCIAREMQSRQSASDDTAVGRLGQAIPASAVKPLGLPFFDTRIVAGFPIPLSNDELAQDTELLQMLCPHPDSSYLIRVQGNSMIEAGVHDGDILIVDKSLREPTRRQIAVCELNGEYTVKRVVKKRGSLWLVPANPEYPEIKVEEGDDFSVWGVVTYIIHKPTY